MVTSSSPTVFESSTMMVLIAQSSILIFCGRCFFLYSKTSWGEKRENITSGWTADRYPQAFIIDQFSHSISQHVVVQSSSRFKPDSFPGIIVREEESIIWCWKWNITCSWQSRFSIEVKVTQLSPNLVLSGLQGPSPWWSCRHRTPGWMARTASSSPRCTGAHRSSVTKPPSWWVA